MATITVGHLIDMLLDQVQDESNDLWEYQDLLNWYNLGTRRIVSIDPRANPVLESIKLASGVRQAIPPGGISVLGVTRNMGIDGATPGRGITETTLDALRRACPSYSTETASAIIYNWMRDPADKTAFWVYPPADGTSYVEVEHGKVPTIIVYDDDGDWRDAHISLKDDYIEPLTNYLFSRAYGKDTDIPGNEAKANKYWALFASAMGLPVGTGKED